MSKLKETQPPPQPPPQINTNNEKSTEDNVSVFALPLSSKSSQHISPENSQSNTDVKPKEDNNNVPVPESAYVLPPPPKSSQHISSENSESESGSGDSGHYSLSPPSLPEESTSLSLSPHSSSSNTATPESADSIVVTVISKEQQQQQQKQQKQQQQKKQKKQKEPSPSTVRKKLNFSIDLLLAAENGQQSSSYVSYHNNQIVDSHSTAIATDWNKRNGKNNNEKNNGRHCTDDIRLALMPSGVDNIRYNGRGLLHDVTENTQSIGCRSERNRKVHVCDPGLELRTDTVQKSSLPIDTPKHNNEIDSNSDSDCAEKTHQEADENRHDLKTPNKGATDYDVTNVTGDENESDDAQTKSPDSSDNGDSTVRANQEAIPADVEESSKIIPADQNLTPTSESRQKKKLKRTQYSKEDLHRLNLHFQQNPWLSPEKQERLASTMGYTETQIKTWFQNKRASIFGSRRPKKRPLQELCFNQPMCPQNLLPPPPQVPLPQQSQHQHQHFYQPLLITTTPPQAHPTDFSQGNNKIRKENPKDKPTVLKTEKEDPISYTTRNNAFKTTIANPDTYNASAPATTYPTSNSMYASIYPYPALPMPSTTIAKECPINKDTALQFGWRTSPEQQTQTTSPKHVIIPSMPPYPTPHQQQPPYVQIHATNPSNEVQSSSQSQPQSQQPSQPQMLRHHHMMYASGYAHYPVPVPAYQYPHFIQHPPQQQQQQQPQQPLWVQSLCPQLSTGGNSPGSAPIPARGNTPSNVPCSARGIAPDNAHLPAKGYNPGSAFTTVKTDRAAVLRNRKNSFRHTPPPYYHRINRISPSSSSSTSPLIVTTTNNSHQTNASTTADNINNTHTPSARSEQQPAHHNTPVLIPHRIDHPTLNFEPTQPPFHIQTPNVDATATAIAASARHPTPLPRYAISPETYYYHYDDQQRRYGQSQQATPFSAYMQEFSYRLHRTANRGDSDDGGVDNDTTTTTTTTTGKNIYPPPPPPLPPYHHKPQMIVADEAIYGHNNTLPDRVSSTCSPNVDVEEDVDVSE